MSACRVRGIRNYGVWLGVCLFLQASNRAVSTGLHPETASADPASADALYF